MKKLIHYTFLTTFLVFTSLISLNAQPHSGQQNGGGTVTGDRIGAPAGAPVGSGTFLLIGLAGLYGGKRFMGTRKSVED